MSSGRQFDHELRNTIVDHLVAAVTETPVEDYPFPHILVRSFFPATIYARLLEHLPAASAYEEVTHERHYDQAGQSNRGHFQLADLWLNRLPDHVQKYWRAVRNALGSVALKDAVFQKLSSGLVLRYGGDAASAAQHPGHALPVLYRETAGYRIAPHPDTRKKVVTMQIALPLDSRQASMGTEFYRRSFHPATWLREPKGFEIVKTMPFVPNVAYAFVVLNTLRLKSWHGRTTIAAQSGVRNSILNIWYDRAEHGCQDIQRDNGLRASSMRRAA